MKKKLWKQVTAIIMVCALTIGTAGTNVVCAADNQENNVTAVTANLSENVDDKMINEDNIVEDIKSEERTPELDKILKECKEIETDDKFSRKIERGQMVSVQNVSAYCGLKMAIMSNGDLYCWGNNRHGQVGNGTTTECQLTPVKVLSNVTFATFSRSSYAMIVAAITSNGDLYCWGYNNYGQVGNGTTEGEDQRTPVKVLDNVASVDFLSSHFVAAITSNGDLYCWGNNGSGQVGNGTATECQFTPVKVLSNVTSVASPGYALVTAITSNGDLYCWGNNEYGQVGDGTTKDQYTPVKVLSNVKTIPSFYSDYSAAAITNNGDLYCWGNNEYGQVGNGTTTNQTTPVKVLSDVTSCPNSVTAITSNGDLYRWGDNRYGQVGNGTITNQTTPVKVLSDVTSCPNLVTAITSNGDLYRWGNNEYGQVGNGTTKAQYTPVKVLSNVISYSSDRMIAAAITNNGDLYCWGNNMCGQVGNGTTEAQYTPVKVLDNVICVDFSRSYTDDLDEFNPMSVAAITSNGDLYCWGYNAYGQVGNGTTKSQYIPVKVLSNVKSVFYSDYYETPVAGAITSDGNLYCWGQNGAGQVGNGTTKNQTTPFKVLFEHIPEDVTAKVTGNSVYNGILKIEVENVPEDAGKPYYQWYRTDKAIEGATEATYTPVKEDIGKKLFAVVSYEGYAGEVRAEVEGIVEKAKQMETPNITEEDCQVGSDQITVKKIENVLYSIDGKEFTENNVFTGLEPKTTYQISVKYAETDTYLESAAKSISVTTTKIVPTVKDKITANCTYGTTLATIDPVGEMVYKGKVVEGTFEWNEENASKIYPKTGESYQVIFRPNDTETYEESIEIDVQVFCEAKKITVKAISASAIYGQVLPSFDFKMDENDLVGSDTKKDLALTLQTNASQRPDAGNYTITKKECGNPNYDVIVESSVLTIEKAKPTIEITNTKEIQGSVAGAKAVITPESADAKAVIEYKAGEADAWTEQIPTEVGTYTVRAYLPEEKAGKNLFTIPSRNAITAEYRIEKKDSSSNEEDNKKPSGEDNIGGSGNNGGNTSGNTSGNGSSGIGGGSSSGSNVVIPPVDNQPSKEDQNTTDTSKDKDTTTSPSDNTDEKDSTGKDNNISSDNKQNNEKDNNKNDNSNSNNKNKKSTKKKKVKLNKKKASVKVGKTIKLKVLNTKKKITWSSNKPKIAKVNKKGKVTALKAGKAVIKAKIKDGKTLKFKITIRKFSKK